MDAQTIVDTVAALDENTALAIVTSILQSRPELAPPTVSFAVPDLTYPPSKAMTERRSRGTIKSINHEKGFGFIFCEELHEVFGSDVFVHVKQAGAISPGEAVSFAVMLNKENRPQAYDVQPDTGKGCGKGGWAKGGAKGEEGGFNASSMMSMMAGFGGKTGGGGGDKGKGKPKGNDQQAGEELGQFEGTIKSFNPKSGYGFINCEDLKALGCSNDVFLHHQQLGDFEVGANIMFTAYMNFKGQPQAKDLSASGGGPAVKKVKLSW